VRRANVCQRNVRAVTPAATVTWVVCFDLERESLGRLLRLMILHCWLTAGLPGKTFRALHKGDKTFPAFG
jgi:hypothetical protein